MKGDDLTLGELRGVLRELVAVAGSAERPKPSRVNGADHAMPGAEWVLYERERPYGSADYVWTARVPLEPAEADGGLVYVSTPDAMHPEEFVPMYASDARRLGMILLAAADEAEARSAGVGRLEGQEGFEFNVSVARPGRNVEG